MFIPSAGALVEDRYQLTRVIGRGGMGEIWEAYDRQLEGPCAVKFILQHLANDKEVRSRFAREAKAVARLRTPHAVHIFSVGEQDQTPYLAMELLQGETLYNVLERAGRLSPSVTLNIVEQIADALTAAHQAGIVHRDLKPDNVWLCVGSRVFVKVLDFGVAKVGLGGSATLRTATGSLVGTPNYMSPEQARGTRDVDHRSDLWSLAVITLECLSGKRPFESDGLGDLLIQIVAGPVPEVRDLAPDLPPSLQSWLVKALERDPARRFQNAAELVSALRPHLTEGGSRRSADTFQPLQSSVRLGSLLRNLQPRPRGELAKKALVAVAAVSVLVAIGATQLSSRQEPSPPPADAAARATTEGVLPDPGLAAPVTDLVPASGKSEAPTPAPEGAAPAQAAPQAASTTKSASEASPPAADAPSPPRTAPRQTSLRGAEPAASRKAKERPQQERRPPAERSGPRAVERSEQKANGNAPARGPAVDVDEWGMPLKPVQRPKPSRPRLLEGGSEPARGDDRLGL